MSTSTSTSTSTITPPVSTGTSTGSNTLFDRQSGIPIPERIIKPTVLRPRTTPAVSSPLRDNVINGSSPTASLATSSSASNGGGIASKGFAVNLMTEVIKNNTPEKKPDVGNPYQAAAPVKLGTHSSVRTKLAGKRKEREPSVESSARIGNEKKEKERVLTAKDIIEATVPKVYIFALNRPWYNY